MKESLKLAPRTFRIEWDLHAWSGAVASVFLFVPFFCGIFALFHEELHTWQDPALHVPPAASVSTAGSFDDLLARLQKAVDVPRGARVYLSFDGHIGHAWAGHEESGFERGLAFDRATGAVHEEHSRLADETYAMHFFNRVPGGIEFTGVLAAAMLVAVLTGLLIHLKDLMPQLWRFRPQHKLRFSASDAHKVLGVFGLPFTVMFGWTGALLGLWGLAFSGITGAVYAGDEALALASRGEFDRPAANAPGARMSLDALWTRARQATGAHDAEPHYVGIQHWGDAHSTVRHHFKHTDFAPERYAVLDAASGAVLTTDTHGPPSAGFEQTLFSLHFGRFGGTLVDILYTLLALAVCAVIVTGNLVWLERRDRARAHVGNRLLERFTVGGCGGNVLFVASYCLANRAVPAQLATRADVEFGIALGVWALALGVAFVPRFSPRALAFGLSATAAALFLLVVIGDVVMQEANLFTALALGAPRVFIIEALLLALGVGSGALAFGLARVRRAHVAERQEPSTMRSASERTARARRRRRGRSAALRRRESDLRRRHPHELRAVAAPRRAT